MSDNSTMPSPRLQEQSPDQVKPKRKQASKIPILLQAHPDDPVPLDLPPEIAAQCPIARQAFIMLLQSPSSSFASIARRIKTDRNNLTRWARAGRWRMHLIQRLNSSPETTAQLAQDEARASRVAELAANRLVRALLHSTMNNLADIDEDGCVTVRENVQVADVEKFIRARGNHIKTTMMLTGEDQQGRMAAATAGAARIMINTGSMMPEPVPITVTEITPTAP